MSWEKFTRAALHLTDSLARRFPNHPAKAMRPVWEPAALSMQRSRFWLMPSSNMTLANVLPALQPFRTAASRYISSNVFIVLFFCSSYFMSRCRTPGLLQEFVKIIAPGVQAFRLVHQYHVFRKEAPYLSQCPASRGVVVEKGVHLLIL